ncbi:hypothetical protein FA13DRAFT_708928 [Coprinellus micaceus]|uniref:DUF6533 domain-containing protein n=1 Tax=Coprinellus micaceus TaxID=71717 RepID=A0A4Y7TWA0_COPMI|nr:hypothetical protein FA13DRAFT_708928 [Coprinellus micaceus]
MLNQVLKLFTVSNLCLLVFDYLLTFEDEVSTVWTCPWSIGLPLFYLNRYLPLIDETLLLYFGTGAHRASKCSALFNTSLWLVVIGANAAHTIIYLQTCALWQSNRVVKIFLLLLLVATLVMSVVCAALQQVTYTFLEPWDHPGPPTKTAAGCRLIVGKGYTEYTYMMVGISQGFTIGLMLYKGVQHVRQSRSPWVIELYQNGVLYCLIILALSLMNAIVPNVPSWATTYANILGPFQHTMESILCSRVMFVILKRRKSPDRPETHSEDLEGSLGVFTSVMDSYHTEASSSAIELEARKPPPNPTSLRWP